MLRSFARAILTLIGWRTDCINPKENKYVLIGAPHTTNWDFPMTLLGLASMGVRFNWVAKHTLFRWPIGILFRAIGGIAVDRRTGTGFLKSTIDLFQKRDHFILVIAPECTPSKTTSWKTGFYTIAEQAGIPIVLGYIDYEKKKIGIGRKVQPSGNIEEDFKIIQEFYKYKKGK